MKTLIRSLCVGAFAYLLTAPTAGAEMVFYLPMDEGAGAPMDVSGNDRHGAFEAEPDWIDGKFGKALSFQSQKWMKIPVDDPDIFINPFTVTVWINPPLAGNTWQQVVRCGPHDGSGRYSWFVNNGGFMSWRGFAGGGWNAWSTMPGGVISANEWTQIAIVNTGDEFVNYVNGEEAHRNAFAAGDGQTTYVGLGWDGVSGGEFYDGAVDDVAVFDEALSADDIAKFADGPVGEALSVDPQGKTAVSWGLLKFE